MRKFQLFFGLLMLSVLSLLAGQTATAQTMRCVPNGDLQAQLVERYDETIIDQQDVPNGRAELWANDNTGTFTILFFPAGQGEAVVCIAGAGQSNDLIDQSEGA